MGEAELRFYPLYDKVYREDILYHAYGQARANHGAPGVEGESFEDIENEGLEEWLKGLRKELHDKTYRPQPVRRKRMEKPGGGERPLGIATIRDRGAQAAAKLILEPICEADREPNAYGYRPRRRAQEAIQEVGERMRRGYTDIGDADRSQYCDNIPHSELLQSVARRIVDKHMLHRIKRWWKVPVEEREGNGKRRLTGGKDKDRGTPPGGVVSPLLANRYINRMLQGFRQTRRAEQFRAQIGNYADDFVILSRGKAKEALEWTRRVLERRELTLHEKKTSIRNARQERFDFLGYTVVEEYATVSGKGARGPLVSCSRYATGSIRR